MEVIHSGKALGGEVRGFDLSEPWTEERVAFVKKAWGDCLVVLFRGQNINDEHMLVVDVLASEKHNQAIAPGFFDERDALLRPWL